MPSVEPGALAPKASKAESLVPSLLVEVSLSCLPWACLLAGGLVGLVGLEVVERSQLAGEAVCDQPPTALVEVALKAAVACEKPFLSPAPACSPRAYATLNSGAEQLGAPRRDREGSA